MAEKRRPDTGTRTRYHHGNLRPTLISEAVALIAEEGADKLTLRAVARRAGVTHAAPYRHFKDKAALLAAVAQEGFRRMKVQLETCGTAVADPLTRFNMMGGEYVRFAMEHPAHYRVMFGPDIPDKRAYPELDAAAQAAFDVVAETLAACQEKGLFARGDPTRMALTAWSMAHGLSAIILDNQIPPALADVPVEQLVAQCQGILFLGLRR